MRWKAAVVFDKTADRPILHTETHDLSTGGAAIRSEYGDLTGTFITLLLAQPGAADQTSKMIKVRAKVVSCVPTTDKPGFRHGLSFVRSSDDGLGALEDLLKKASSDAPAPQQPAAQPPSADTTQRLNMLKQMAQAKLAEGPKADPQEEIHRRVREALERAFGYLKDFAEQLDVVKPAYKNKGYMIPGVPEFSGLAWESGSVDLHSSASASKRPDRVSLHYRIAGPKHVRATREFPRSEKVKQMLVEHKIEYHAKDQRNAKGSLESTTFMFDCEIKASLILEGRYDTGKLLLKTRNVEHFGALEQLITPEVVTAESLEQLAAFILGETNRLPPLLTKGA